MAKDVNRLERNLRCLEGILPGVAMQVRHAELSGIERNQTRKGESNLLIAGKPLHASYSAVKEAERWFESVAPQPSSVLFVYGVGLGYALDSCRSWLREDPGNYLVFIEDDLRVLHCLMETERGSEILDHRQVQLHYLESLEKAEPMISWLTWYFIRSQIEISALPSYAQEKPELFGQLRRWLSHDAVEVNAMVAEYMRHGAAFFHNYYSNTLQLSECYSGDALSGRFQQVPAIICGAGPSLDQSIPLLKELERHALILAGGSSVNALTAQGVTPHLGGGIDPNPPQLQRLHTSQAYALPYLTRGRMYHPAFQAIKGPRLQVSGSGGYAVSEFFEKALGITSEPVDEGHNVINFLMDSARMLGCNPIILVGMDLAYTGLRAYAGGVLSDSSVKEEDILQSRDLDSNAFVRPDINGNPVYTVWKWVTESQWVSNWSRRYPQLKVVNATGGGIGFEGIPNLSLEEVARSDLQMQYDLKGRLHAEIERTKIPQATPERMEALMEELHGSLRSCRDLCEEAITEIEQIASKSNTKQTPNAEKIESALLKEAAFECVLSVFNEVFSKVQNRFVHQIKHDWRLTSKQARTKARLELNREKFTFLRDVAQTNLEVIEDVAHHYRQTRSDSVLSLIGGKK